MKHFNLILQIVIVCLWGQFDQVKSQNNRLWMEIGKELFLVEPEGQYTWKQAVKECRKEHSNLINPKGDYDYAKLKEAIKHNFQNYSSFWTINQVERTTVFHHIGLGRDRHDRQKCYKIDSSSGFKYLPDNCDYEFGFICEKPLLETHSLFYTKNMVYFVQPAQEFTCEEATNHCEQHQMHLVILKDHDNNKQLKDYLFINYGSGVNFWFGYNNETHYNCATRSRGEQLKYDSQLGFICQRTQFKSGTLSMRHMILLIFVTIAAVLAAIVFVVIKCFCSKKVESFNLPEAYFSDEVKTIDIR